MRGRRTATIWDKLQQVCNMCSGQLDPGFGGTEGRVKMVAQGVAQQIEADSG